MTFLDPIQGNTGLLSQPTTKATGISAWLNPQSYFGRTTNVTPASAATDKTILPGDANASATPSAAKASTWWSSIIPSWGWNATLNPATEKTIDPGQTAKTAPSHQQSTAKEMYLTVNEKGWLWNSQARKLNSTYDRFKSNKVSLGAVEGVTSKYQPKMNLWDYQTGLSQVGLDHSEIGTVFKETVDLSKINDDNRKWLISNYFSTAMPMSEKWAETGTIPALTMRNQCLTSQAQDLQSQIARLTSECANLTEQLAKTQASSAGTAAPSSAAQSTIVPK